MWAKLGWDFVPARCPDATRAMCITKSPAQRIVTVRGSYTVFISGTPLSARAAKNDARIRAMHKSRFI